MLWEVGNSGVEIFIRFAWFSLAKYTHESNRMPRLIFPIAFISFAEMEIIHNTRFHIRKKENIFNDWNRKHHESSLTNKPFQLSMGKITSSPSSHIQIEINEISVYEVVGNPFKINCWFLSHIIIVFDDLFSQFS